MVVLRAGLGNDFDARSDAVAITFDALESDVEPVVVAGATVHPELGFVVHGGDNGVDAAIAVEFAEGAAAMAGGGGFGKSGFFGKGLPFSAGAEVAEDGVGLFGFGSGRMGCRDVAARDEEVLPAVVVKVVKGGAETRHAKALRAKTAAGRDFDEFSFSVVLEKREGLLVERDISDAGIAVVVKVPEVEAHARDECAFFRQGSVGLKRNLFEPVAEVMEEEVVLRVVGDKQVGFAIEVVIGDAHAHTLADVIADTPLRRDVLECAVALVEKELIGRALIEARVAVFRDAFDHAKGLVGVGPLHVIDDEEVEQAIVVDVDPSSGNGPERAVFGVVPLVQAGLFRDVRKGAVAIVVVKGIAVDAGNKNVGMAIVVVISDGHSDVKPSALQASFVSDVGKDAVAVVPVQTIPVFGVGLLPCGQGCSVGEEDVGPAVAVVIEDGHAAGHRFGGSAGWTFVTLKAKSQSLELEGDCGSGRLLAGGRDDEDEAAEEDCAGGT